MRYRYHWSFKLLALVLAAVSGAVLLLGAAGLVLDDLDYYEENRRSQLYQDAYSYTDRASRAVFDRFAWKGTGIEPKLFERFFRWGADVDAVEALEEPFYYTIRDIKNGRVLETNAPADVEYVVCGVNEFDVRRGYVTVMPKAEYYPSWKEYQPAVDGLVYVDLTGQALPPVGEGVSEYEYYVVSEDADVNWQNISLVSYSHEEAGGADYTIYRLEYTTYETYRVETGLTAEQMADRVSVPMEKEFLPLFLRENHHLLVPMVIWGGLVLLMSILWLTLTAGRSPEREEGKPGGLNLIPLDLYLAAAVLGCFCLAVVTFEWLHQMVWDSGWGYYEDIRMFWLDLLCLALCGSGIGGILTLFFMACAAQMKMGSSWWLKHTAVGLVWQYGWKFVKKAALWCWSGVKRVVRGTVCFCKRFARMLPLTWQWLIASGCVWLLMFFCILYALNRYSIFAMLFGIVVTVLLVLYGAYCFGVLRDAARKMSGGNLEEKVDNQLLAGCFGEFAGHLNALGDTCIEAARQQMKSERMKSELITNVSHDIKTPLTSIINYVDLLQKTDDEQERAEYLEVLDRQSQRLKKLIEDLMEMSRASSGNVAVEITPTDVTEAVNQALGEFADTLETCGLTVMLKAPAEPVMALGDGKHLWRVLSNCLSNVVKYAMPGTRVYVDVVKRGTKVEVSIKNISAGMLNISAEELMERFVRGDSSRNTEGNGLGLNIAKSLMELMGGRLELVVDGDLFKVVLTLNAA